MTTKSFAVLEKLYPPSCPMGYTTEDLERYFGAVEGEEHPLWDQLHGQTGSACEGTRYNYDTEEYEPSACADHPHGFISYTSDVLEWVAGGDTPGQPLSSIRLSRKKGERTCPYQLKTN